MTNDTWISQAQSAVARVRGVHGAISADLAGFGGFLRCTECGRDYEFGDGDHARFTAHGWPKCCGYTMRWWTQAQIDRGEVQR